MPAMTVKQLSEMYGLHPNTVRTICRCKGSPAFRTSDRPKAEWRCDRDEFEEFLIARAEGSKG